MGVAVSLLSAQSFLVFYVKLEPFHTITTSLLWSSDAPGCPPSHGAGRWDGLGEGNEEF